jgi:hypothetical protein
LTAPAPGRAAGAETRGRTAGKLFEEWKSAGKAATRPDDDKPQPTRRRSSGKETGGGIGLIKRAPLKRASQGRAPTVKPQPGRVVIGLARMAARVVEDFNRAMKEAFLSPRQLALERDQQRREAADRQAAEDTAERLRAIEDWFEEQRRRLLQQQQEADNRQPSGAAFAEAKAITAPELPAWLAEFFEIEADPDNPLDLSNPDRDLVLGDSDVAAFDAGYIEASGPSLDLG